MKRLFILTIGITLCSFGQSAPSPYSLNWKNDGWLLGTSAVAGLGAFVIETNLPALPLSELRSLDKNAINPIDRITAGVYRENQSTASDVLVGISIASPIGFLIDKDFQRDFFILATMYAETEALSAILPSLGKGTAKRIRPYVYSASTPLELRTEPDAQRSFFSRHTTFAFSTAVLTSIVYSDYYPSSRYRSYVWIGTLGLASSVAVLRVTSGAHFISDVVVGAAVGSAIGYIIPYIHRTAASSSATMSVAPLLSPPVNGISISVRF